MTTLFWDCFAGIAGNMAVASLLDAGVDLKSLEKALTTLPFEEGPLSLICETRMKRGVRALYFNTLDDEARAHEHDDHKHDGHNHHGHAHHGHSHPHLPEKSKTSLLKAPGTKVKKMLHPHHHHYGEMPERGFQEIKKLIESSGLSKRVKDLSLHCFRELGEVEAKIHGTTIEKIHFHEVGGRDSIADMVSVAFCVEELGITSVAVSPINVGYGFTSCRHGKMPVPAPATAELLAGYPIFSEPEMKGEMTTPTGAALIKGLGATIGMPAGFVFEKIGYGAGSKEFETPNVLRAFLSSPRPTGLSTDHVVVLETNLDNVSGELLGHVMDELMTAGALDVSLAPIQMKKGRPGHLLSVLVSPDQVQLIERLMFQELPTLGVRRQTMMRSVLQRGKAVMETELGSLRAKRIVEADGAVRVVPEFDELRRVAKKQNVPVRKISDSI